MSRCFYFLSVGILLSFLSAEILLMAQLKIGGRLVIPVGEKEQVMTLLIRKNETQFEKHEYGDFKFVPLLENKN